MVQTAISFNHTKGVIREEIRERERERKKSSLQSTSPSDHDVTPRILRHTQVSTLI